MAEKRPVNGFLFSSTEEINLANKEAKAVAYLRDRLKGRSPEEAAGMYSQILSQNLFHTVVGYTFLKSLQDFLSKNGIRDLEPIKVDSSNTPPAKTEAPPPKEAGSIPNPRLEKKLKSMRATLRSTRIVAVVCMLMVVAMFAITLTSKSPTIIDYEKKVLDKYASWEQELTERERAVSAREAGTVQDTTETGY